jgi:hypothetical protein
MKMCEVVEADPRILNLSKRRKPMINAYPVPGSWVGNRSNFATVEEQINLCPCQAVNPDSPVIQTAA